MWNLQKNVWTNHFAWVGRLGSSHCQGHQTWIPGSRDSCHTCLDRLSSSLSGSSPQALTHFRESRFITWHLKCSFLGECWRDPKYFWSCQACLGYGPVPGPTLKKALCHTHLVGGTYDKYQLSQKESSCRLSKEKSRSPEICKGDDNSAVGFMPFSRILALCENANSFIQDLKSVHHVHILQW